MTVKLRSAYFVFLLETVQTALTGADVHYWFIQGFGNVEQLKKSHYAPIDIPIVDSIISFVVQQYFCYRIWTLNKQLFLAMCWNRYRTSPLLLK